MAVVLANSADKNKHSFFSVQVKPTSNSEVSVQFVDELLDEFVDRTNLLETDFCAYVNKENFEITLVFKVEPRKRTSYIRKCCDFIFPSFGCQYYLMPLTKDQKVKLLETFSNNKDLEQLKGFTQSDYTAKDIRLFENKSNYFPWQKDLYNKIFNDDDSLKPIEDRKIISIVDPIGKSGKSTFVKYLCYKREDFVKLSYGTSMQLRSAILNVGSKKCYLIDLPRTTGAYDKKDDILSVIEDLKNGHLTSPMYGKYSNMLMDPPIVIVFSNIFFPYDSLSADRWDCYLIKSSSDSPALISLSESEAKKLYKKQQEELERKKFHSFLEMEENRSQWAKEFHKKRGTLQPQIKQLEVEID